MYDVYVNDYLVKSLRLYSEAKEFADEMVEFLESFYVGRLRPCSIVEIAIPGQKMRMRYAEVEVDRLL